LGVNGDYSQLTVLARKVLRDVKSRGRDIEGCIKQWFSFVKPNFHKYVEPQREVADLIVPRGIENKVAISMVSDRIRKVLSHKSQQHQSELRRLAKQAEEAPLSPNVIVLEQGPQVKGINTLLLDPKLNREDFIFYFDRIVTLLIERAVQEAPYTPHQVLTPQRSIYMGLQPKAITSATLLLRGGSALEPALRRVIPNCLTGRILIQTPPRPRHRDDDDSNPPTPDIPAMEASIPLDLAKSPSRGIPKVKPETQEEKHMLQGEPELHYRALPSDMSKHGLVLLLDTQMSSGGAALMAVRVLIDHGVEERNIVFVTWCAAVTPAKRLMAVFPEMKVVVGRLEDEEERRWIEEKYLGC